MSEIIEMLSYPFMIKALAVGLLVAVPGALIGVSLILRRNAMIGDGLSHTAFGAMAVAVTLGLAPLPVALPLTLVAAFVVLRLHNNMHQSGDTAVAVLSAVALAVGVMAVSLGSGVNIDLNGYLFGSVLSVGDAEVALSAIMAVTTVLLYILSHHRIFAITFDAEFARSAGVRVGLYDAIFAMICAAVVVLGMRLLGALLISSIIIFPALTATQIARSFRGVVGWAVVISVVVFAVGLTASYLLGTPTGATVVIAHLITLGVASAVRKMLNMY